MPRRLKCRVQIQLTVIRIYNSLSRIEVQVVSINTYWHCAKGRNVNEWILNNLSKMLYKIYAWIVKFSKTTSKTQIKNRVKLAAGAYQKEIN